MQAVFPDNAYGVDSGGDPQVIPALTFEEFKVYIFSGCIVLVNLFLFEGFFF